MNRHRFPWSTPFFTALIATGVCLSIAAVASAQEPDGPPPPPPGGGFGPGPGFGSGPGFGEPGRGPRQATAIDVPASVLASGLKLTGAQKTKVAAIQKQLQQQRQTLMPRPGDEFDGPPDWEAMRTRREKIRSRKQTAASNIQAVLTPAQKKSLPALLKEANSLRSVGIPLEVYGSLNLSSAQKTKLVTIAQKSQQAMRQKREAAREEGDFDSLREAMQESRKKTRSQALALLTAAQRSTVETYLKEHPQPQPGGGPGGGPGGFGGGRFAGPPPGGPQEF